MCIRFMAIVTDWISRNHRSERQDRRDRAEDDVEQDGQRRIRCCHDDIRREGQANRAYDSVVNPNSNNAAARTQAIVRTVFQNVQRGR